MRVYFRRNMTEQAEHPLLEPFSKWGIDGTMTEQDGTNRDSLSLSLKQRLIYIGGCFFGRETIFPSLFSSVYPGDALTLML